MIHAELGKYEHSVRERKEKSERQATCCVSEVQFHFSLLQDSEKPNRTVSMAL